MYHEMEVEPSSSCPVIHERALEQYIRCPCCYHRLRNAEHRMKWSWKEHVEQCVQEILNDFFTLPMNSRTSSVIQRIMERRWTAKTFGFESEEQHQSVKHVITAHLLMLLDAEGWSEQPMFLLQDMSIYIEELNTQLQMMFHVIEWYGSSDHPSYIIKKWFIHDEPHVIKSYLHLCLVFAYHTFGMMPARMEVVTLLTGKSYIISPALDDIARSMDYIQLVGELMQENENELRSLKQ
ncbi:hypothetical protein BVG16_29635 [Paenibacillus selenitireducens]|uniref:Uncharacterized protein n=2 Tax=Paenibacillus selenitireducens TaxID=1324314 RepID=A0A1T2X041_9BACL|nr:hypothetical protein BVG16_29635 [Paenibacillus selenitireducens]